VSDATRAILEQLAGGRVPENIPDDVECADELKRLAEYLSAVQRFTVALATGDLNASLAGVGGPVAGGLKSLQASLRHLTWQTRQVAAGDFSQRVDFMGDFSVAFNAMVSGLAEARQEMERMNVRLQEDLVRLRRMAGELREGEERFRLITGKVNAVIWTMDAATLRYTYVSPYVTTLCGLSVEEALAETLEESLTADSLERFREKIACNAKRFADSGDPSSFSDVIEVEQFHRDGHHILVEMVMSAIIDGEGRLKELVGISRDITARNAAQQQLVYLSCHDSLTGLYNRAFFDTELERLTHGRDFPLSVIVADLDGLKTVNDTLGHAMGDRLIKGAAAVLRMALRSDDVVARTGGDEFVALLPCVGSGDAAALLGRIRSCEESYNAAPGPAVRLSLGAATALCGGEVGQALMDADSRMYADKALRKRKRGEVAEGDGHG
jgi:diguanylate cyclase (GGDEF)-like protein/PAS domain S-box-containing protein